MASFPPPAAVGTTREITLLGYASDAHADAENASVQAAAISARRVSDWFAVFIFVS